MKGILFKVFLGTVGSYYVVSAADSLMTYPNDLTFIFGLSMMAVWIFGWIAIGYQALGDEK